MIDRLCIVLLLTSGLALTGCDIMYGVRRDLVLKELPDLTCVERVVRAAPGVQDVRSWTSEGGRPLTLSGTQQPDRIFNLVYSGRQPKIWGALQLIRDYKGKVQFSQTHILLNHPPDPIVIANTRPVMREIEFTLSRECGIPELPAGITEFCRGVDCPPMS